MTLNKRVPELDGVRGLAILLVLVWHYLTVPLGRSASHVLLGLHRLGLQTWSGVDLFFVLSGFLIGGILIDARGSTHYFRTFYLRRVCRIFPIYIALCVSYPLWRFLFQTVGGASLTAMPWYSYATFTQNFWLAKHAWPEFLTATWSLAVEEQFYLTLPALIWVIPPRYLWKVAVAGVAGTMVLRTVGYLHYYPNWGYAAYTLIFCRSDALLLGVLGACIVRSPTAMLALQTHRRVLYAAAALTGSVIAAFTLKGWGMMSTAMSTVGYTTIAIFYFVLLLMVITNQGMLSRGFSAGWLRWLGSIAYGLYLIHGIMLLFVYRCFHYAQPRLETVDDAIPMLVALAGSLLLANLSWKHFESRIVRLGHAIDYGTGSVPLPFYRLGPSN